MRFPLLPLLVFFVASPAFSQTAPAESNPRKDQLPLLRTQTSAVIVDVVVTGRGDEPVPGLSKRDFSAFENGKPQSIDFFEEHAPGAPAPATTALPPNVFSNQPTAPAGGAVNVLLLDSLNSGETDQANMRKQMLAMLHGMPAGTVAAVYGLGSGLRVLQGFTADPGLLESAMSSPQAFAAKTVNSTSRDDILYDNEEVSLQGSAEPGAADARSLEAFRNRQAGSRSSLTLLALDQIARALAAIPGRKNLIWIAGTFPLSAFPNGAERQRLSNGQEIPDALRRTLDLLTQARVAVYPVSAQGILLDRTMNADSSGQPDGDDFERAPLQQTAANNATTAAMEQMASATGGKAIYATNDIGKAVDRVVKDGDSYYTLAYTPTDTRMDGKFRTIEIRVPSGKYKLAYRRGYFAALPTMDSAGEPAEPLSALMAPGDPPATQLIYRIRIERVTPQPAADAPRLGGNAHVAAPSTRYRADFTVPVSGLKLAVSPDGSHSGNVEFALIARDRSGAALNWTAKRVNLKLSAESWQAAKDSGLPLHIDLDIPQQPGITLCTGVYNLATDQAGTLEVPLSAAISAPDAAGSDAAGLTASGSPTVPGEPVLRQRPATPPAAVKAAKLNRLHIDVVVDDGAGKPLTGLQPWDFKLLDNGQPDKILFFRAFDGVTTKPDPPVEVIIMLDEMNLSFAQTGIARDQIARFLRQNGGHLAQPVTLMLLNDKGLEVQPRSSLDGNWVATLLNKVNPNINTINAAMGLDGALDRFRRSMRQMQLLAENETHKPGRKLLIWVGTGWPMLETENFVPNTNDRISYFKAMVLLSGWLRQARMTVYSVSMPEPGSGITGREIYYQNYLKPVLDPHLAESGNLSLRVLAIQTGGLVLGPDNDLAAQINQCVADADDFYQLTFEAPQARQADEYHALTVQVSRAGAVVRTTAGYYDEPPND